MSVVEKSIGELLVDNGQISADELRLAEREAKSTGEPLSVILQRLGLAYEHHFKNALELKYGVTYVSLSRTDVQPEILKKVPESKLREHMMVPVNEKGNRITVVMVNPEHAGGLSALKEYFTDRQFTPVVCTEDDFMLFMSNLYAGHLDAKSAQKPESNGAKEEAKAESKPAVSAEPEQAKAPEPDVKAEAKEPEVKFEIPKDSADSLFDSVLKKEVEPPTNDETGKFDLNMLQKHIEETRNKAGKKPSDDGKKAAAKDSGEETISPEKTADKPEEKPAVDMKAGDSETAKEPEAKAELEKKSETKDESAQTKQEEKKETRPDARDVARALAKEMAEESKGQAGGAIKDDEATGEFEALVSPAAAKAAAKAEPKVETPEKTEPAAKNKEEPVKEAAPEEKPAPVPMDQTGEDFKAVSPKSGPEGGFGECEPVASESVARPAADEKSPSALEKEGDDAAVIMLCNQILANGIAKGASTIHVEAVDKQVLVHYRIQQQLMIVRKLPKMLMPALTARFRKMARVDTQDRRLPQDGRVKVRMSGKDFSLRLTIVPHTAGGEHILVWIE